MIYLGKEDFLISMIQDDTTVRIMHNTAFSIRMEFAEIIQNANYNYQVVEDRLRSDPFNVYEQPLNDQILLNIYNLIRDNEVDHLRELLNSYNI